MYLKNDNKSVMIFGKYVEDFPSDFKLLLCFFVMKKVVLHFKNLLTLNLNVNLNVYFFHIMMSICVAKVNRISSRLKLYY